MSQQSKSSTIVCDKNTGAVLQRLSAPSNFVSLSKGQVAVEYDQPIPMNSLYYDCDEKCLKQKRDFESGVLVDDYYTLNNVPVGTTISWQGETYEVNDGSLELLIDQPGNHTLHLYHPHYNDAELKIEN